MLKSRNNWAKKSRNSKKLLSRRKKKKLEEVKIFLSYRNICRVKWTFFFFFFYLGKIKKTGIWSRRAKEGVEEGKRKPPGVLTSLVLSREPFVVPRGIRLSLRNTPRSFYRAEGIQTTLNSRKTCNEQRESRVGPLLCEETTAPGPDLISLHRRESSSRNLPFKRASNFSEERGPRLEESNERENTHGGILEEAV